MAFRELLGDIAELDVFDYNAITAASAASIIYRAKWLPQKTIQILPTNGLRPWHNQSMLARRYLAWIQHKHNIRLRTGMSPNGEAAVYGVKGGPYAADGLCYCCETIIYEVKKDFSFFLIFRLFENLHIFKF